MSATPWRAPSEIILITMMLESTMVPCRGWRGVFSVATDRRLAQAVLAFGQSATGFAAHGGLGQRTRRFRDHFTTRSWALAARRAIRRERGRSPAAMSRSSLCPACEVALAHVADLPFWLARNGFTFAREIARADAVFPALPSPVGLLGLLRSRHEEAALHSTNEQLVGIRLLWQLERAYLERIAGGRNIVMATGSGEYPPSTESADRLDLQHDHLGSRNSHQPDPPDARARS